MTQKKVEYVDADLTYIIADGKPSIRYVDWPEEAHKEQIASYENRTTRILNGRLSKKPENLNLGDFAYDL